MAHPQELVTIYEFTHSEHFTWIPKGGSLEMKLIMEFHGLSFQINVF